MFRVRVVVFRVLVALALIVQIFAPVGSSAAMMRVAFDPLVDIIVCAHDQEVVDRNAAADRSVLHHGDACGLCQLVAAGGHAPPPSLVELAVPAAAPVIAEWRFAVEAVTIPRLLDRLRGRAPPSIS